MMEHLTAVLEETEKDLTAAEATTNGQDDFEHGEKIRVDRRKLEQMLQENGDESGLTAEIFFKQVMHETGTFINWPSKLKIGAKSKKDPHIKIAGLPENIKKAKDMVVVKLESKANRVTLKMDVSHTDHSHIIGRRGQNINKVMDETSCHIHFPDSNRGSASLEKSNQVSVTGQPEGVERARARIREMLPLVLCFEIPNYDHLFLPLDPMLPSIQNIAQTFDVTFTAKGRTHMTIRGSQDKAAYIQDALACLSKQLTGSLELLNVVQLHLDVAPQHHMFLIGRSACNIREIMERTNTKIELPDPRSSSSRNGVITVTGSIPAVIQARSLLVNCLPLLLMFDLKEDEARYLQDSPDKVRLLMDKFGVTIAIKSKPKQSSKSVTIKSKECNAPNMYLTRLEILGNPMDPLVLRHPSSLTLQFDQPSNPWFARIQTSPSSSPLASPTPLSIRSDSPILSSRRTPPPGHNRVPPGFESRWSHRRSESFNGDFHRRTNSPETDLSKIVRGAASEGGSPTQSIDFTVPRRNSEPTPYADVWKSSPTSSKSKAPGSTPSLMSNSKQRYTLLDGIKNAESHRQLLDSHGSNPASSLDSLASTSFNFDRIIDLAPQNKFVDYEKKKDISTELMTRKVAQPEVRIPTGQWSGLHLSKSADVHAFKKEPAKVEKEETERQSPSREIAKSELDRAVMRNPSASMQARTQVPRETKTFHSPLLKEVLGLYGVGDLAEQFKNLEIDNLDVFLSLTKEDLKEAGFEPLGQRKKIENAIEAMKKIRDDAIMKDSLAYRAQSYHVSNPLEYASRSGRY